MDQAKKIIELRPFPSADDLKTKLGQGRKKAGPAGISSRMFEDCLNIFAGYGRVDDILQDCEQIGAELKSEITRWTDSGSAKPGRATSSSRSPSISADGEGALSLTAQALSDRKPSYYLSSQPSLISKDVQLKGYQLVGVNWLNLLYRKKLSCILADEMGEYSYHLQPIVVLTSGRSGQNDPGHQLLGPPERAGPQGASSGRRTVRLAAILPFKDCRLTGYWDIVRQRWRTGAANSHVSPQGSSSRRIMAPRMTAPRCVRSSSKPWPARVTMVGKY